MRARRVRNIAVGEDDETWDIGTTIPHTAFDELLVDLERESQQG